MRSLASLLPRMKTETVHGQRAPGPRPTLWAAYFFTTRFALPVLGLFGALDLVVYLAGRGGDGPCLSLICWLGY
jgi:hypothetical protein